MSDFEKQLKKIARETSLSVAEKRELKARVVSFMEYHPRRERIAAEKAKAYLVSQPYSTLSFHNRYIQAVIGLCAVFILIIIPTMAEKAIPGDILYPFKVRINEEVRGSLTFSPTQKIEWETERLERRIAEVRLLESKGELTKETEAEAIKAVQAHAEAVQNNIKKLRDTDAEEASLAEVAFASALDVQSFVLESDNREATGTDSDEEDNLEQVVKNAKAVAAANGTTTPSYEKIIARLESETTRAHELFESLDGAATDEEKSEIKSRLSNIERKIQYGIAEHESEIKSDLLIKTLSDIRKLISFMTDIDVRTSVTLETLLPLELTDEEKTQLVEENVEFVNNTVEKFTILNSVISADIKDKLEIGLKFIENQRDALDEATKNNDLDAQVRISKEMKAMADDINTLIIPFEKEVLIPDTNIASSTVTTTEEAVSTTTESTSTSTTNVGDDRT